MKGDFMPLSAAADHIQLDVNEIRHLAQRGEIESSERGGELYVDHESLDGWAQLNIISAPESKAHEMHKALSEKFRREKREVPEAWRLFRPDAVDLHISAKAKAGIVRDMTDLADASGLLYDPDALFRGVMEREELASTAIGPGVAFLHPKCHDPYIFEESFVAYGRSDRTIFFGAPDGAGTRHFFLVCSTDHEKHLHILSRLAVLAHGTALVERLDEVDDAESAIAAIRECEREYYEKHLVF